MQNGRHCGADRYLLAILRMKKREAMQDGRTIEARDFDRDINNVAFRFNERVLIYWISEKDKAIHNGNVDSADDYQRKIDRFCNYIRQGYVY